MIDALLGAVGQAFQVLWGHVLEGSAERRRFGFQAVDPRILGQIEIQEHRHAVVRDQHVRRLDVAVRHSTDVGVLQAFGKSSSAPCHRSRVGSRLKLLMSWSASAGPFAGGLLSF